MFKKNKTIEIFSAMKGKCVDLTSTNDPVFSEKILGDGVAIVPATGEVFSPVNGEIVQMVDTKHAIGILSDKGVEILIHLGFDTVSLNGEGFETFIKVGDKVKIGDKLIEMDIDFVKSKELDITSPIIITNISDFKDFDFKLGDVKAKEDVIISCKKA